MSAVLRSVAGKVMWVGRATVFLVGLTVILALVVGVTTTALGATNGNFILGKANSAATPTTLVGTFTDAVKSALVVQNKSGGPALDLRVGNAETPANGVAPMRVNSSKKVARLNADEVGGLSAEELRGQQGEPGPQGATGPAGPQGETGVQGPPGPEGVEWRGAWSNAQSYSPGDAVSYAGGSYIAKARVSACTSICPIHPPSSQWDLLARGGETGAQGPQGPQGVKGDTGSPGPQGPQGPQGSSGISGYEIVQNYVSVPFGQTKTVEAQCPGGKKVIGGGADGMDMSLLESGPDPNTENEWRTTAYNGDALSTDILRAYAICANVD